MPANRRPKWPWLVVAALLLVAAAWLMADADEPPRPEDKVKIPRRQTDEERARAVQRRTMPEPEPVLVKPGEDPPPQAPRDPVLAALPPVKKGVMVVEANAIRHSELGPLMIDCLFGGGRDEAFSEFRDAGFDPLENLDRVAVADKTLLMSGDFSRARFDALGNVSPRRAYGPDAEIFDAIRSDGGIGSTLGLWRNQMLVTGESEAEVKAALDRLSGKGNPNDAPPLAEADAYGEMYGNITPAALAELLGDTNPQLSQLLNAAAGTVKLHADVSHDVGMVADFSGTDPKQTDDLRKALGTGLTLAKLQAEAKGNKEQAEILDYARVRQADLKGEFRMEAGLPNEFVKKQLEECVRRNKERKAKREAEAE